MGINYNSDNNSSGEFGQELAFDLRQKYAQIVGEHLEDVSLARKGNHFNLWLKNLQDLHVIVKHKFKKKEDEKEYNKLINNIIILANKYSSTFLNQSQDPNECAIIENSLREIEMFLYLKMNEANMFGDKRSVEGLM